jgi:L-amino acid N-acyltransferase YncA
VEARGHGLQRRLIKVREQQAKRNGWRACITYTAPDNFASANSLIKAGYRLYGPSEVWAMPGALYWRKWLTTSESRSCLNGRYGESC